MMLVRDWDLEKLLFYSTPPPFKTVYCPPPPPQEKKREQNVAPSQPKSEIDALGKVYDVWSKIQWSSKDFKTKKV